MTDFIKVATLADIGEGELYPVEVEGEPVCLAKVEGNVYAFTDNCSHVSGPLNEGVLDGCIVSCPWHGAHFDVTTGKVLRGPARYDIPTYQVRVEGEDVLISLPPSE